MVVALVAAIVLAAGALALRSTTWTESGWVNGVVSLPGPPRDLAVVGGAAWVSLGDRDAEARLAQVDLTTGDVTLVPETTGARSVAADGTGVWVSVCARVLPQGCDGRAIARVDPQTATVQSHVDVEGINLELAVDRGLVWASMSGPDQLEAFDARDLHAVETVPSVGGRFTVGQDAAWGLWELSRVPEVREWPAGGGLSKTLTSPPGKPRRVDVPDACALAVGSVDTWLVSCPVARAMLVVHTLRGGVHSVTSILTSGGASPAVIALDHGAVVAWIDAADRTLELRTVALPPGTKLPSSIDMPDIASAGWGPAPPLVAIDGTPATVMYVAVPVGSGGSLLRMGVG